MRTKSKAAKVGSKTTSQLHPASGTPTAEETNALITLFNQGRYAHAEPLIRALLLRYPKYAFCHKALGAILRQQGNAEAALESMLQATILQPDDAEAHYNLAVILKEQGRYSEAEVSYRKVVSHKPNFAQAHNGLGHVFKAQNSLKEAEASFRQALKLKPDFVDALDSLAQLMVAQGKFESALGFVIQYLQLAQNSNAQSFFVHCVIRAKLKQPSETILGYFVRALSEPWGNPAALIPTGVLYVKSDPAIQKWLAKVVNSWPIRLTAHELFGSTKGAELASNPLLTAMLVAAPICDVELERLLTTVRKSMLDAIAERSETSDLNSTELGFYCALSRQCFINEYVYAWTEKEAEQARALRDDLVAALETEANIPVLWIVAVAAYYPVHGLLHSERLLKRAWPDAVNAMLAQLVGEPAQELQIRASMPLLTPIDGEVSLLVQNQYEANPYPRWIKVSPAVKPMTVNEYLRQKFPLVSFQPFEKVIDVEILIAGCGTGRHSIGTARKISDAHVLAIDLSLTSLSYAKRKTQELGLTNIDYAQADILKLGSINRTFDVIESGGVLHHLADPFAGWRVLLSLLRPGGFMGIALYSAVARRHIFKARTLIADQGYASTVEDIRQCRQDLMGMDVGAGFSELLKISDFFSISDCRDLLFHVQEHCMTLTEIEAFLSANNLQFLGFQVDIDLLRAYQQRFPNDLTATNLSQWQMFENDNPDIFIGMYQFWVHKPS